MTALLILAAAFYERPAVSTMLISELLRYPGMSQWEMSSLAEQLHQSGEGDLALKVIDKIKLEKPSRLYTWYRRDRNLKRLFLEINDQLSQKRPNRPRAVEEAMYYGTEEKIDAAVEFLQRENLEGNRYDLLAFQGHMSMNEDDTHPQEVDLLYVFALRNRDDTVAYIAENHMTSEMLREHLPAYWTIVINNFDDDDFVGDKTIEMIMRAHPNWLSPLTLASGAYNTTSSYVWQLTVEKLLTDPVVHPASDDEKVYAPSGVLKVANRLFKTKETEKALQIMNRYWEVISDEAVADGGFVLYGNFEHYAKHGDKKKIFDLAKKLDKVGRENMKKPIAMMSYTSHTPENTLGSSMLLFLLIGEELEAKRVAKFKSDGFGRSTYAQILPLNYVGRYKEYLDVVFEQFPEYELTTYLIDCIQKSTRPYENERAKEVARYGVQKLIKTDNVGRADSLIYQLIYLKLKDELKLVLDWKNKNVALEIDDWSSATSLSTDVIGYAVLGDDKTARERFKEMITTVLVTKFDVGYFADEWRNISRRDMNTFMEFGGLELINKDLSYEVEMAKNKPFGAQDLTRALNAVQDSPELVDRVLFYIKKLLTEVSKTNRREVEFHLCNGVFSLWPKPENVLTTYYPAMRIDIQERLVRTIRNARN